MNIRWHPGVQPLLVDIDTVHQLPGNPRNGDIETLMESIRVNGFYTAVTVDTDTRHILAGNHRYAALLGLGATQIPVIWAKTYSTAEGNRIAVADNRLSDLARNDPALLAAILTDLNDTEIGLIGTGFTEDEYQHILDDASYEPLPEDGGLGFAPNDIYQVVIECDTEEQMNDVYATCLDHEWKAREVRL